jgi:Arc/MetJ-type ribon-helix-helix transcriptional regulator
MHLPIMTCPSDIPNLAFEFQMEKPKKMEWCFEGLCPEPRWNVEPDIAIIEKIARANLNIPQDQSCTVTFFSSGAFNKLYRIDYENKQQALLRVTLPVYPGHKTASEVATIRWIHGNTTIPIPKVLASDTTSGDNELGFEWMIVELVPADTAWKKWRKMTFDAKQQLVKDLANYQAQLLQPENKFKGVGSLYGKAHDTGKTVADPSTCSVPAVTHWSGQSWVTGLISSLGGIFSKPTQHPTDRTTNTPASVKSAFQLGPIVSLFFFQGDHVERAIEHGPFKKASDWMRAYLNLILGDQEQELKAAEDEEDIEDIEFVRSLANQLWQLIPTIFPDSNSDDNNNEEETFLAHPDLSSSNILVHDNGQLAGIIDWECTSTVPFWEAIQMPKLLTNGQARHEEPNRDDYPSDDEGSDDEYRTPEELELDSEGKTIIYWEHLMEYEKTKLRQIYQDEMEMLCPGFREKQKAMALQADFHYAVTQIQDAAVCRKLKGWIRDLQNGTPSSLRGDD